MILFSFMWFNHVIKVFLLRESFDRRRRLTSNKTMKETRDWISPTLVCIWKGRSTWVSDAIGKKSKIGFKWHLFTRIPYQLVALFSPLYVFSRLRSRAKILEIVDLQYMRWLALNSSWLMPTSLPSSFFVWSHFNLSWSMCFSKKHQDDCIGMCFVNSIVSIWEDSIRDDMFMFNWNAIAHRTVMSSLTVRSSVFFDWWNFCLVYFRNTWYQMLFQAMLAIEYIGIVQRIPILRLIFVSV